jgi:hypothetical protein
MWKNFIAVIAQSVQCWAIGWTVRVLVFNSQQGLGIFVFTVSRTAVGARGSFPGE